MIILTVRSITRVHSSITWLNSPASHKHIRSDHEKFNLYRQRVRLDICGQSSARNHLTRDDEHKWGGWWVGALSGGLRPNPVVTQYVAAGADWFVFQRPYVSVSGWLSVEWSGIGLSFVPHCSPFRP